MNWQETRRHLQPGEEIITPEPEQNAGELEQPEVILGLLVPADQDRPTFGEPHQPTFDYHLRGR